MTTWRSLVSELGARLVVSGARIGRLAGAQDFGNVLDRELSKYSPHGHEPTELVPTKITHFAGAPFKVPYWDNGRPHFHYRQRCGWCGQILIEYFPRVDEYFVPPALLPVRARVRQDGDLWLQQTHGELDTSTSCLMVDELLNRVNMEEQSDYEGP